MIEVRRTDIFADWLKGLKDPMAKAHILTRIKRFGEGHLGDVKPVGEGVSEARIHSGPGYRVYFVQRGSVLIILLNGGSKGSQQRDIKRAIEIAKEV